MGEPIAESRVVGEPLANIVARVVGFGASLGARIVWLCGCADDLLYWIL